MLRPAMRAMIALSLTIAPTLAAAQSSAPSAITARASADIGDEASQLNGDAPWLGIAIIAAIIVAAFLLSDGDRSTSP